MRCRNIIVCRRTKRRFRNVVCFDVFDRLLFSLQVFSSFSIIFVYSLILQFISVCSKHCFQALEKITVYIIENIIFCLYEYENYDLET